MKYLGLLLLVSVNAYPAMRAIYGEDNRKDVYEVKNPLYVELAKSTAAMISKDNLKKNGNNTMITARSLGDMFKLCPEERFRAQPTAANCSGTLVAPDLIMTAAHCYDLAKQTCKEYAWVFDYKVNAENQGSVTVPTDNVYECESVVLKEMMLSKGIDHALIRLKRPVTDRPFAKLRSKGEITEGEPLVLIGHPNGLPTKIAANAFALEISENSFTSNVDAFSINSGSGVFNGITGEVEGILSSGQPDYDGTGNCTTLKRYGMDEGMETVVKVNGISEFLKSYRPKKNILQRIFRKQK